MSVPAAVLTQAVLPHLSVRDLCSLAISHSQLRDAVSRAPAAVWQHAGSKTLPSTFPPWPQAAGLTAVKAACQRWTQVQRKLQAKQYAQIPLQAPGDWHQVSCESVSADGNWMLLSWKQSKHQQGMNYSALGRGSGQILALPVKAVLAVQFWRCSSQISLCWQIQREQTRTITYATLYSLSDQGVKHRAELPLASGRGSLVRWSPCGRLLAYLSTPDRASNVTSASKLHVLDLTSNETAHIPISGDPLRSPQSCWHIVWSPDSRALAFYHPALQARRGYETTIIMPAAGGLALGLCQLLQYRKGSTLP